MQCIESVKGAMVIKTSEWDSFACVSDGPDTYLVFMGVCRAHARPPSDAVLIYAPDFFLTSKRPWYSFERVFSLTRAQLLDWLGTTALPPRKWSEPDFVSFRGDFESLSEAFRANRLKKGVPVVFKESLGTLTGDERLALLASLVRHSQGYSQDVYAFWNEGSGVMGVTPERLFHQDTHGLIQLMAVAGTRLHQDRDKPGVQSLLEDPKEQAEHQWVIESIQDSLKGFGALQVGRTEIRELAHLSHLVTSILCTPFEPGCLSQETFLDLIQRLHPTAALGAFPREEGWRWLQSRAHPKRAWFGGPFGILGPGVVSPRVLVMIRNIQWDPSVVRLGAGCGVIRESRIEKEWDEILGKMRAITKTFAFSDGCSP